MNKESLLILRARMLQDTAAFSSLVGMHQGKVRAFLVRLTRDYDVADDLAQETFINAFNKLRTYRKTGSFSAWLFQIAYNNFLQSRRRETRRLEVTHAYQSELEIEPSRYQGPSFVQLDLERALSALKPEQTAAITLCHSFGFTHTEAAAILDIPVGTVKTNILRGKEKLKSLLQTEGSLKGAG